MACRCENKQKLLDEQYLNLHAYNQGIALVDSDGSITGDCGAVIVGLGAHLRLPGCVEKPEWNATICPPNQIPRQNFVIEDARSPQTIVSGQALFHRSDIKLVANSFFYTTMPRLLLILVKRKATTTAPEPLRLRLC
jgi:hypothetical protein